MDTKTEQPENVDQAVSWAADSIAEAAEWLSRFDVPKDGIDASVAKYPNVSDACVHLDEALASLKTS